MRVIIVEDELKIRNGLTRLLSGYDKWDVVANAKNGAEGLELILRENPDLVMTDIKMPVMDGLEMLYALRKAGNHCHVVILTGYAEFDYAQKALEYGVDSYLLKPITVEDVESVLSKTEERILNEAMQIKRTPEEILRGMIQGEITSEENVNFSLLLSQNVANACRYYLICGRYDRESRKGAGKVLEAWKKLESDKYHVLAVTSSDAEEIFGLWSLSGTEEGDWERLRERMDHSLTLHFTGQNGIWIYEKLPDLTMLKRVADQSCDNYIYELVSPCNRLISLTEIRQKNLPEYPYSVTLEHQLKKQICFGTQASSGKWIEEFTASLQQKEYDPGSVRQAFIRMAGFVMNLTEEVFPEKRRESMELDTIRKMGHAVIFKEFCELLTDEIRILYQKGEANNIRNYTILKAITYIREHYAEHISQEEVAERLNISPEYLSTLFHKEMNINFAAFINSFRVSQAKRILKGSDLKVYEVSEKVGFSDTKYFNKVFKDIVGVSPKEYREM